MTYVPEVPDAIAGRRNRARAYAQHLARKRLRERHPDEYEELYREEVERLFRERGLGIPWARPRRRPA